RRCECHRGRAVGPDPHRMRGLPFQLTHVEMLVASGAAPIDAARRLTGEETPVLPEIFPGSRALPPVQPVDHGGGNLARLQYEARQRIRERARLAGRTQRCLDLGLIRSSRGGHQLIRAALSLPTTPSTVSPSARAAKVSDIR